MISYVSLYSSFLQTRSFSQRAWPVGVFHSFNLQGYRHSTGQDGWGRKNGGCDYAIDGDGTNLFTLPDVVLPFFCFPPSHPANNAALLIVFIIGRDKAGASRARGSGRVSYRTELPKLVVVCTSIAQQAIVLQTGN